jgi:hypothetical protein
MKKSLVAVLGVLAFASTAFAATAVTEPKLPDDIASWKKADRPPCTPRAGVTIDQTLYLKAEQNGRQLIVTTAKNGELIGYYTVHLTTGGISSVGALKNHQGQWEYRDFRPEDGPAEDQRYLDALGLTLEEFMICAQ